MEYSNWPCLTLYILLMKKVVNTKSIELYFNEKANI